MHMGSGNQHCIRSMTELSQKVQIRSTTTQYLLAVDNVTKEGLRIENVLVRIGTLSLIRDKVKVLTDGSSVFKDDIISRYPGLIGGRVWKEHHDKLLLQAVMNYSVCYPSLRFFTRLSLSYEKIAYGATKRINSLDEINIINKTKDPTHTCLCGNSTTQVHLSVCFLG